MALSVRSLAQGDVAAVEEILLANRPVFSDVECAVALEMIGEALARPDEEDPYQLLVAEEDGRVVGYACFGKIPLTQAAFDLYWIAVAPDRSGRGIGRALMRRVEEIVAETSGAMIVVETSGRADYGPTRSFYERTMGYETASRIRDFYKPGDDKVVYLKRL